MNPCPRSLLVLIDEGGTAQWLSGNQSIWIDSVPSRSVLMWGILEAAPLPKYLLGLLSRVQALTPPKLGHFASLNLGFLTGGAGVTLLCRASIRSVCLLRTTPGVSMLSSHRQHVRLSLQCGQFQESCFWEWRWLEGSRHGAGSSTGGKDFCWGLQVRPLRVRWAASA